VRVLDTYCCGGGAGWGYHLAGAQVTGVDNAPQPDYPLEFVQADAVEYILAYGHLYDFIHASPPCQAHTDLKHAWNAHQHADLIPATREALREVGKPYIIENVEGAPLKDPVILCGSMFRLEADGYQLVRHRQFEASFSLPQPDHHCKDDGRPVVGCYGGKVRNRRAVATGSQHSRVGTTLPLETGQKAMGIDWLNRKKLSQAIPPAYTRWIAEQWMSLEDAA
jgi:DNA (cytosine-5)-methyltransferase 1